MGNLSKCENESGQQEAGQAGKALAYERRAKLQDAA